MKTILIVLIALMFFFAGCASTPTNQTTTTTQAGNTQTTQAAGQNAETTPAQATATTIAQPAVSAADYKNKLMALFGLVKDYVVTYDVTTHRGNNLLTSNQITYYINADNTRLDTTTTRGGRTFETRYYTVDNQSESCTNSTGSWTCLKINTPKILADMKETIVDNIQTSSITQLADKTILGIDAKCYHLVMNLTNVDNVVARRIVADGMQDWEGTYCGTDKAVMLYYESTNNNLTVTLSATDYHAGTAPSDFTLPATLG